MRRRLRRGTRIADARGMKPELSHDSPFHPNRNARRLKLAILRVMDPAPRSHFVERDELTLHHLDWGTEGRDAIVVVHGSRLHAHVWNDFGRRFSDRYHIIAVDQRGHG